MKKSRFKSHVKGFGNCYTKEQVNKESRKKRIKNAKSYPYSKFNSNFITVTTPQ